MVNMSQFTKQIQKKIIHLADINEPKYKNPSTHFHKVDLTNFDECLHITKSVDFVFNLVGIKCSPKMCFENPADIIGPMLQFNTNMLEAAMINNIEWYLYTSSVGVYHPSDIMSEDDVWKTFPSENDKLPGWSKRIGELQAEGYKIQHDWDKVSIVRPANVYGNWDNFDLNNSMVIPSLIRKGEEAGKGGIINVWGDGTPIRDFIHARDVARGMIFAVENKITEPLNLGCGEGVTIKEIAQIISDLFESEIEFDTSKPNGDKIRLLDMERIYSKGFELSISIEDGIKETIDWYLNNKSNLDYRYSSFEN